MTPGFLDRQLDELLLEVAPPYSTAEVRRMCAVLIRSTLLDYAARCDALADNGRAKWTDTAAIYAAEDLAASVHADVSTLS